jgi:hypothetical protein
VDDALASNVAVDHKFCEKDPYVNGGTDAQDTDGVAGKKTATETKDATFEDEPNAVVPKIGKNKFTATFELCAYCADTNPATSLNECMTWTYVNSVANGASVTVTGGNDPAAPGTETQASKDAIAKFDTNHVNNTVCPEKNAADAAHDENGRIQDIDPLTLPPPGSGEGRASGTDLPGTSPTGLLLIAIGLLFAGMIGVPVARNRMMPRWRGGVR